MEGTGYSCPRCKRETGATNEILAGNQKLVCKANPLHEWNDMDVFFSERPTMDFPKERPRPAPQANHAKVSVSVPAATLNKLQAKFGDRLDASLTASLNSLAEGSGFNVSQVDMERLTQALPERPRDINHLFGMIYALSEQRNEYKLTAETAQREVKAYEGMNPGKVMIDLGAQHATAAQKALDEGVPLKVWVEQRMITGLESGWW